MKFWLPIKHLSHPWRENKAREKKSSTSDITCYWLWKIKTQTITWVFFFLFSMIYFQCVSNIRREKKITLNTLLFVRMLMCVLLTYWIANELKKKLQKKKLKKEEKRSEKKTLARFHHHFNSTLFYWTNLSSFSSLAS